METKTIVSNMNSYLHLATEDLSKWLDKILPKTSDNWWDECVIDKLSFGQREQAENRKYSKLSDFDLAALLRITERNWYVISNITFSRNKEREVIRDMKRVRNNWAHCSANLPGKDEIVEDIGTLEKFFGQLGCDNQLIIDLDKFAGAVKANRIIDDSNTKETPIVILSDASEVQDDEIKEHCTVYITANPEKQGYVESISERGGIKEYKVFVDNKHKTFYSGQIALVKEDQSYNWLDVDSFRSYITAYQINNPSNHSLYSLNSARIDFVPYQFRPAMKLLHSDEPRILIADSVGVGKTIEAGLIIKELEARNELKNILIICPKPLVAEQKWELEMKRFDEKFTAVDSAGLRNIIKNADLDGEWPVSESRLIIPYSILDEHAYEGDQEKGYLGLIDLDPEPHFDLVIVDEAHHIRNGSKEKEKAFAYKCVHYFCEHADAVVMLTATPLQTSDNDLFTLLNILRPDLIIDKDSFAVMSKPNKYISQCLKYLRSAKEGWQDDAQDALTDVLTTQWGEDVIAKNPVFSDVLRRLSKDEITREERVALISDVESLHSFNSIINRTRRRDIQDFCIRRTQTREIEFTEEQKTIHDELLMFERKALSLLHGNVRSIPFMMTTLKRQAASCIFGLAPHIGDWIHKRLDEIEAEFGVYEGVEVLENAALNLIRKAENLPETDPKLDSMLEVIKEKQTQENNKVLIFSEYKYTLTYLRTKLRAEGYRVEQVDGSVKDADRQDIRGRFELPKDNNDAVDILLFTEVGTEGLDYQFCNMMINYDLPWNPMRIEQRIGRIDRRGQESESVTIINMITKDTVDYDVYNRCLLRIGIFENFVGECEEILGNVYSKIMDIAVDTSLTDEERGIKLEQMADNEVRKIQEMEKFEEDERELFGFDTSEYSTSQDIQRSENPWISRDFLQLMVEHYLNQRLGEGRYILGDGKEKSIRLNSAARLALYGDFKEIKGIKSIVRSTWANYLKGHESMHSLTFDSEAAERDRKSFFITTSHPLVRQAARYFSNEEMAYLRLQYASDSVKKGRYYFSVYAWKYTGTNPHISITTICDDDSVAEILPEILIEKQSQTDKVIAHFNDWESIGDKHIRLWQEERKHNNEASKKAAMYKIESLDNNYKNLKRSLERKMKDATDIKMIRMHRGDLENKTEKYKKKRETIISQAEKADIYTTLLANGIIDIV